MSRHTIRVKRAESRGFFTTQSIGNDALNALQAIPGIYNPEIGEELDDKVTLTYEWMREDTFWQTDEYLLKFGLSRDDWDGSKMKSVQPENGGDA